ncbi:signal recognition particle subunit SEC65 [Nitrobacteraceae bacterium AZCC 1564]
MERAEDDKATPPRRLEEARQIVEEYANALREIIKALRRRLN